MSIIRAIRDWQARRRKRIAGKAAAAAERKRAAIIRQVGEAQAAKREWKSKIGELRAATLAALVAENEMLRG